MQHFLSSWKATFYLLVLVLVLHLEALLMKQDFALLDTVPTLGKRAVLSQIFISYCKPKGIMWI